MDPLAELATQAPAGDRAAAEKLCRALEGPIYRLSLRVLGHPEDARDASQEIRLQVLTPCRSTAAIASSSPGRTPRRRSTCCAGDPSASGGGASRTSRR
jgi:hypothetical protein